MRALLADLLIAEAAAERRSHQLRMSQRLQTFVQALEQRHEELDGVLLLAQVHRLSLESKSGAGIVTITVLIKKKVSNSLEMSPKTARNIKLMNAVTEMGEDRLNMLQYPDVIISSTVPVVILQLINNLK